VEARVSSGWEKIIGDTGRSVSDGHYGVSADYQALYRQFGITAAAARGSSRDAQNGTPARMPPRHLCPGRQRHRRPPCLIRKACT
jgi:transketolase